MNFWWCGNGDGIYCMGVMVKNELCGDMVYLRMVSDKITTVVLVLEDVLRLFCGYAPQS